MKRLIGFAFLLIGSISYSQAFDSTKLIKNELYGQKHKRWQVDSQMIIPKTGDTTVKAPGQIKILSNTFMYTGQDRHWHIAGAGSTSTTSDTYTTAQVDSAIAANRVRFGIEDNVGVQDRSINFQNFGFTTENASYYDMSAGNGGLYISKDAFFGEATSQLYAGNYYNLHINNNRNIYFNNGLNTLELPHFNAAGTLRYFATSVNGNFADSTGNIDLGAIGGTAGVTSFNSRSGAVVSQFTDYSAYYQPLGRYIDSLRRVGTTVSGLINGAWIPQYTDSVGGGGITTETDPLSVHITDSSAMLSPYLRSANAAVLYQPAGSYATTSQLDLKVNISDTASMLAPYLKGNQTVILSGDVTGSGTTGIAATLATVNSNVGTFTNATVTVNAKGLVTAVSTGSAGTTQTTAAQTITATAGQTVFAFTSIPSTSTNFIIFVNGGKWDYTTGYTYSGNNLTTTSALDAGDKISLVQIK